MKSSNCANSSIPLRTLADRDCDERVARLIEKAKSCGAYGPIEWGADFWDVSASERQYKRTERHQVARLNFTQHKPGRRGSSAGPAFSNDSNFSDVVKSIVRLRFMERGQRSGDQFQIIRAFRYLYVELETLEFDPRMLTGAHFDCAQKAILRSEKASSAYALLRYLEEVGCLLDYYGVVRSRLAWKSTRNRPAYPSDHSIEDGRREVNSDRLPSEEAIRELGRLYNDIPKRERIDRLLICLVGILLWTGFRVGELLSLPLQRVQRDSAGQPYINFFPEKGGKTRKKVISSYGADLVDAMLVEIASLTDEARMAARWMAENPGHVWLGQGQLPASLTLRDFEARIGLPAGQGAGRSFCRRNGIANDESGMVNVEQIHAALSSERFDDTVVTGDSPGDSLLLQNCLAIAFKNELHRQRGTQRYVVLPLRRDHIALFLTGRPGMQSVFQRYSKNGADGETLKMRSHGARHFINDVVDRGGMSDALQAEWFGRGNPHHNRAYQHMSRAERTEAFRNDLMTGRVAGGVEHELKRVPIERRIAYVEARVRAVHSVPGGLCIHDFAFEPCRFHMQCTDGCGDFSWIRDDESRAAEMETARNVTEIGIEVAKAEMDSQTWGASPWLAHQQRKLEQMNRICTDCKSNCKRGAGGESA